MDKTTADAIYWLYGQGGYTNTPDAKALLRDTLSWLHKTRRDAILATSNPPTDYEMAIIEDIDHQVEAVHIAACACKAYVEGLEPRSLLHPTEEEQ